MTPQLDEISRRRRHARLIAALTGLVGGCAEAAAAVYRPIAEAPPEQTTVSVTLVPALQLAAAASTLVDTARTEDEARWPHLVAREADDGERTSAARCATAEAEEALWPSGADERDLPGGLGVFSAPQGAYAALMDVGEAFLSKLRDDPEAAVEELRELAQTGEYTVEQVLDEVANTAVLTGLIALQEVGRADDPSRAAEDCLLAARFFALAVSVASVDIDR
ncbi:hypothetical protein ABTZ78_17145 [Streptomyces bauhiniae]|uniref:hypothetical protein n=1 Tax=Streptomyces bauhiniae TaxID=2340725 RepID=UPI00332A1592